MSKKIVSINPKARSINEIEKNKLFIKRWLEHSYIIRRSSKTAMLINEINNKKVSNKKSKVNYPRLCFWITGIAGGYADIPDDATVEEILAQAMMVVMGRGTKSCIYLSESETITIVLPGWRSYYGAEYPHIAAYDRILIYPKGTTKDELIANAKKIAATWCPMACVIWSATETIWGRSTEEVIVKIQTSISSLG